MARVAERNSLMNSHPNHRIIRYALFVAITILLCLLALTVVQVSGKAVARIIFGSSKLASVTDRANVAQIRVQGGSEHPSAFHGDLELTASVGGTEVTAAQVTIQSITVDEPIFTLLNDMPVTRTVRVEPATEGVPINFRFTRGMAEGSADQTFQSVKIIPLDGPTVRTDANGVARFQMQAGFGGQGLVWGEVTAGTGTTTMVDGPLAYMDGNITTPLCEDKQSPPKKTSTSPGLKSNSVALYSGEKVLRGITDLTIPGRGFDYQFTRSYRSQTSHLRPVATTDFGVDWAFSYSDDRLIPDGNNVVVFRELLRTDMFVATATLGVYLPPMGYYERLRINAQGDFELRREDGLVKTYKAFSDLSIPGRLLSMEDRNGNIMRFLYGVPEGLSKVVLTTVVDTMGRNIVYRYFPNSESNVGRRGRLKEIEDFRRDNSPTGRKLQFDYDVEGNLISATSPIVRDTPTGNDFPVGKTTRYTYTREADIAPTITGIARERLLHNLLTIEYPNEAAVDLDSKNPQTLPTAPGMKREILTYGTNPTDPASFDRALTYAMGGTNGNGVRAGGTITYRYEIVAPFALFTNDPFIKTTVTDRRGNMAEYVHSPYDTLLREARTDARLAPRRA